MPPTESAEILAAIGIFVGIVMFLILAVLLGSVALIEEVVVRMRKRVTIHPQEEN